MRIFIYLVALLTGLCTVDAASAHRAAPIAIGSTELAEQHSAGHHTAIIAQLTPDTSGISAAPKLRMAYRANAVCGFSLSTPVSRADRALK